MLKVAAGAFEDLQTDRAEAHRTGVFVGVGLDLCTTHFHFRWTLLNKANLTPKERTVVTLRFGLDGTNEWRTLAEVARHMNCSREYCRQVVQRALRKLRKTGIQSGLVEATP